MKKPTETGLVKALLELLAHRRILAWRNNTTGVFDPVRKIFRTFTGRKGVSDILGVLPGGKLLAVEAKMPKGKLSDDQREFLRLVGEAGGLALVARSVAELQQALDAEGV